MGERSTVSLTYINVTGLDHAGTDRTCSACTCAYILSNTPRSWKEGSQILKEGEGGLLLLPSLSEC